ncbi:MAG: polysaccharide biosynthesis tyrosine autokinase [Bacteroidetes bacterium]|nr:polysaccharide biosynthesis tyrosine autokinase [Bacteroidota bacterium]
MNIPAEEALGFHDEEAKSIDLKDFLIRHLKYLPWIILSVLVSLFIGYAQLRYASPVFEVDSSLLTSTDNSQGTSSSDKFQELFTGGNEQKIKDQIAIIQSRPLVRRVVRALHLRTVYINKGNIRSTEMYNNSPMELEVLSLKDSSISFSFPVSLLDSGRLSLAPGKVVHFYEPFENEFGTFRFRKTRFINIGLQTNEFIVQQSTEDDVTEDIVGALTVKPVEEGNSNVVALSMQTNVPEKGVDILNQLAKEYENSIIEDKNKTLLNTLRFISDRLDSLTGELGGVEGNLQRFREKSNTIDVESQSKTYFSGAEETDKFLTDQEVKIKILDYLDNYLQDTKNGFRPVPVNLGIIEPVLMGSITEYNKMQLERESNLATTSAQNPLIKSMDITIGRLREDILETLHNVRASYIIARDNLLKKNREIRSELLSLPGKSKQLLEIGRQQKIKEELYVLLASKREETAISLASTISNIRVVEPARRSAVPIKPNHRNTYLLCLFAGLLVPVIIIFIFELLNDKITTRTEIERGTAAPILGEIGHSMDGKVMVTTSNSRKFIAEQFRILRTNLQYVLTKVDKPTILITSSFSGEGKSFISTNIGASLALTGKKTVILEFDIRKPKIIEGLGINKSKGITNYIVGNVKAESLPVPVEGSDNLYVVPCGPIPPNPAELLLDPKIEELFAYLKRTFDVVIIDTAPVGLVSDAMVLCPYADTTLYILRHGYTRKKQLRLIDEIYTGKRLPRMAIVINDIEVAGDYSGYYGYNSYGYGYGFAYGEHYFEKEKRRKSILSSIRDLFIPK